MNIQKLSPAKVSQLERLSRLAQPVDELYYLGDNLLNLLDQPCVAIVGSRKVSAYGRAVTQKLATELARAGAVVVSGLAFGVDSIAHQAAVSAGGKTIAVLPSSLSQIYPAAHTGLARQILQTGGALVSEYADGSPLAMKHQFIARNRIIAGLSQGVLITEAAAKSGSLHTAEFALEQGIEVLAVPGNITSPTSEGTNQLIKNGAAAITTVNDIFEVLNIKQQATNAKLPKLSEAELRLVELIGSGTKSDEELLTISGLAPSIFSQTLGLLEINQVVTKSGSNWNLI